MQLVFCRRREAYEALMGGLTSCDYRIQGQATVRNTPEVVDAISQLASDVIGEDYVTVTQVDSNTLELSIDYDDITTIHTPAQFGSFLETIAQAVIGCGVFDIETSGEQWTEWIGEDQAIKESKSRAALVSIQGYDPRSYARRFRTLRGIHARTKQQRPNFAFR